MILKHDGSLVHIDRANRQFRLPDGIFPSGRKKHRFDDYTIKYTGDNNRGPFTRSQWEFENVR